MNAIAVAVPGDHIVLADGVYDTTSYLQSNGAKTLLIRSTGTATNPIVVKSSTIGGAEIKGPAGFEFNTASYVIVQGFKFTHSQDNSVFTNEMAVRCTDCTHVRFTRNHFELTTTTNGQSDWLGITSAGSMYNRIDHNIFANKATEGVFVLVLGSGGVVSKYNQIDHNYFHDQTYSGGNGGECMRIGNSEEGLKNAYATVEYNLFEKCNGDVEAVTIKSSNNTIRENTFRNNQGSLTLRHGNANVVDGNFFLDGKNGLRLYGHNHKIINNYFEGTFGSGSLTTLIIGSGSVTEDLTVSNSKHSQPQNILVAFNTFVNNQNSIVIGEPFRPLAPIDVTIANNIIKSDSGRLVNYRAGTNITWEDNIMFGLANKGNMPTSGYTWIDPKLVLQSDDVYRILNTSPAIDKENPISFPDIVKDMDGQTRSGLLDTGADEFRAESVLNFPLSPGDIGPNSN
jgi:poly(beta-D-mannuronate) lyase